MTEDVVVVKTIVYLEIPLDSLGGSLDEAVGSLVGEVVKVKSGRYENLAMGSIDEVQGYHMAARGGKEEE